jgi:hypothetical protein
VSAPAYLTTRSLPAIIPPQTACLTWQMIVAHTTHKLFSLMQTFMSTIKCSRQVCPRQHLDNSVTCQPQCHCPDDTWSSLQLTTWHCRLTVRTLLLAANNFVLHCRVFSPTAQQTTRPAAEAQGASTHSHVPVQDTQALSLTHLALRAVLGLRGELLQK